jgi:hypothetical protein
LGLERAALENTGVGADNTLSRLLEHLGFEKRVKGSHHVFRKTGVEEMINLQRDGGNAKRYQVRQVRAAILRNRLGAVK